MTINIEYETDKELKLDYENIINRVINEAVDYAKCPYEAEVNVTLTDNDEIKKINAEYRNINNPTDVLSFPMLNFALPGDFDGISDELENDVEDYFNPDSGELMLGDIVVSVEK
ncbi:MAG: rRNA maturation RNase YbeY, partial [Eubacterium sp.]|nr:rRNA maturation RNase YbeY [Eubacterium sp.]